MNSYWYRTHSRRAWAGLVFASLVTIVSLSARAPASELSPDIRFVYLAKWVNYQQHAENDTRLLFYGYGAQVFAVADGRARNASLSGPMPAGQVDLVDDGDKYPGQNLRFDSGPLGSSKEMNKAFPDGDYRFRLSTRSGDFDNHSLMLSGVDRGLAGAAKLALSQCGHRRKPAMLIPGQDLYLSWSAFEIAAPDPRGVMDDLVVVKFTDAAGGVLKRSPLPYFSSDPVIPYHASGHLLPGEWLEPGTTYGIEVEMINVVDSHIREGIPEVAAYVTNTRIMVHTAAPQEPCLEPG